MSQPSAEPPKTPLRTPPGTTLTEPGAGKLLDLSVAKLKARRGRRAIPVTALAVAARDPYFQAAVRREVMDHPEAAAEIEGECSRCHMPMAAVAARQDGRSRPASCRRSTG